MHTLHNWVVAKKGQIFRNKFLKNVFFVWGAVKAPSQKMVTVLEFLFLGRGLKWDQQIKICLHIWCQGFKINQLCKFEDPMLKNKNFKIVTKILLNIWNQGLKSTYYMNLRVLRWRQKFRNFSHSCVNCLPKTELLINTLFKVQPRVSRPNL